MNKSPWDHKEDNKIKAQKQIKYMDKYYAKETADSAACTMFYTGPLSSIDWTETNTGSPHIQLLDMETVAAIRYVKENIEDEKTRIAALNFASYYSPGGKFLDGSNAQEECLCHASNLYNILKRFNYYYIDNTAKPNKSLYKDKALYTPNVVFNDKDSIIKADIITCAAPNWATAKKWNVSQTENTLVLAQRIKFIKDIAEKERVDVLILGAWGCGVFGQSPRTVAKLFDFIFRGSKIKNIIYAVPEGLNPENFKAFDECIRKS